jgi:hypothetical protein
VTFYDGDTALGTAAASAFASSAFQFSTPGVHTLTARLTGDPYIQDQTATCTQAITPATIINLMIVYASDVAFSDNDALAALRGAVSDTNDTFCNSQIPVTVNLVHIEQEPYTSSGNYYTDLTRLQTPNDGYMDNIFALRQQYGADLVSLFVQPTGAPGPTDPAGTRLDGLANELQSAGGNANAAFSVIHAADAGYPYYTLAHELGHNLGASHDAEHNPNGNSAFPSGQGYRFTGGDGVLYHDIMSYAPGALIPYFSNPAVTYMGVAEGRAGSADAAHVIMKTAPMVARFRHMIGAPAVDHLPTGAIETTSLSTITGWAWDADSGADPVKVRMDIDGQIGPLVDADGAHAALTGKAGSGGHGFTLSLPALSVGKHTLAIYAVNTPTDAAPRDVTLLGKVTLTNRAPAAAIELANSAVIAGWVQDQDSPEAAVQMQISVDGQVYGPFNADQPRPDLQKKLGSADHGFSFDVASNLALGAHQVEVDLFDAQDGEKVVFR